MARHALDVRGALLKSGREEFLAHGFEKASLRAICKKAGLTTGAFYSHFSGKEELFVSSFSFERTRRQRMRRYGR